MVSKTRSIVIGAGTLAVVALGGLGAREALSARAPAAAPHAAAIAAGDRQARAPRPSSTGRQWKAGTAFVYEIEHTQAVRLADAKGAGRDVEKATAGKLTLAVAEATPEGVRLRGELAATGNADEALSRAFYVSAERDGTVTGFAFARGTPGAARRALRGLVTSIQLVSPGSLAAWGATEEDGTGRYEAVYRRDEQGVHKTKARYTHTRGAHGLAPLREGTALDVYSAVDFTVDATGWPRTVRGEESLDLKADPIHVTGHSRVAARLVDVHEEPDLAARVAAEEGSLDADPDGDAEGFADAKRDADKGLVAGASYQDLARDLGSGDVHAKNRTMGRMAALFRTTPGEADKGLATVLDGDVDEGDRRRIVGALGGAGTEQAQAALGAVLASKDASSSVRSNAAAALGLTVEPTEDTEAALESGMSSDDARVASASTLGLGNMANRMAASGSADASSALATLIADLQQATTDDERALYLAALGNTGNPAALDPIEAYLGDPDPTVRAAAVFALRFMNDPSVPPALVTAMGDAQASVRRAAVGTLPYQALAPLLPAVQRLLQTEPDVGIRLAIVTALQLKKADGPGVLAVLAWAAAHDPSQQVRQAAASAFGG